MATPFRTTRRMEFHDTDAAGIVHFSRFFLFMEAAEHELLRSLGLSVMQPSGTGHLSWPRVATACEYQHPAHFEEILEIEVSVARLGAKSVTYAHRFLCEGQLLATGTMTAVCCQLEPGQPPRSQAIPPEIRAKLAGFLVDTA